MVGDPSAEGDAEDILDLSQRRAMGLKQILVRNYKIAPNRLLTNGKGETELLQHFPIDGPEQRESK